MRAESPHGTTSTVHAPLTIATLADAVDQLAARDPDIAGIVARFGHPPLWDRVPGFGTLLHIVLEQQVSLASAAAAFGRLRAAADPLTPARFDLFESRAGRYLVRFTPSASSSETRTLGAVQLVPDD